MAIRIGLIGTGEVADNNLIPALKRVPGAIFWSVTSRSAARGEDFARRHGAQAPVPVYQDYEQMLGNPLLDAVIIATPDALHAEQTIQAASHGKHVFVEKPMATKLEDAQKMVNACREASVKLAVGYHMRWNPAHRELVSLLEEARGPTGLRMRWSKYVTQPDPWRTQGPLGRWWVMAAYGTHLVDLARWFLTPYCGSIVRVDADFDNGLFGHREETARVDLQFGNGVHANILASFAKERERVIEVDFPRGNFQLIGTLGPGVNKEPYIGELADFVAAINEGRDPEVDGGEGLENLRLLIEIEQAAQNRKK